MLEDLVKQYYDNKEKIKSLEDINKEIKKELIKNLGDNFNGSVKGYNIYINKSYSFFPLQIKSDMPEIYDKYYKLTDRVRITIDED